MQALEAKDIVLLLDKRFEYGLSGTTLWKKDKTGTEWCVITDSPGEVLLWCPIRKNGGLNPAVTISRTQFGEMF
jgi:hypothetical protein